MRFFISAFLFVDGACVVITRAAGDAASRMGRRAAQPQAFDRRLVLCKLRKRAHPKRLVERELRMVRLSFWPAFLALEIGGAEHGGGLGLLKTRQQGARGRGEVGLHYVRGMLE